MGGIEYKDFVSFPDAVQGKMGYALYLAQTGRAHLSAKPLKGFGSAGVVELVEDDHHGSYRAVYTVKFRERGLRAPCLPEEVEKGHQDAG
jgi:phage-related protein